MKILVINAGSSSIKYQLFNMENNQVLAAGQVEMIGEAQGRHIHKQLCSDGSMEKSASDVSAPDHKVAFELIKQKLKTTGSIQNDEDLDGIGHRCVHGGEVFQAPSPINDDVIRQIKKQIPLAPLHNPANLVAIEAAFAAWPTVAQVGVFDTAFHQTIPSHAYLYALPLKLAKELDVRRYGFHGSSHKYVTKAAADFLNIPLEKTNLITCHLGNGASICAVQNGHSVDTSMGLTPLEGLIMGTRSGDIDPGILFYLARERDYSIDQLDKLLNKESGMKGLCGVNDMRIIEEQAEAGDETARLALKMYSYRIKKYIGMYSAVLGRVDAVVFTAGIGENSPLVRAASCEGLMNLGISIDHEKNDAKGKGIRPIHTQSSSVQVLVVPTDEELEIARQTLETIQ